MAAELEGERVAAVERRGKYLIVRFESGRVLLIHLRMTGSLRHAHESGLRRRPAPTRCCQIRQRIGRRLPRRPALRHVAAARAGRARAVPRQRSSATSRSTRSSPPRVSASASRSAARRSRRRSSTSARSPGMGNIYVDEALWRARIHPLRPARASTATSCAGCTRDPRRRSRSASRARARRSATTRLPDGSARLDAARVQGLRPRAASRATAAARRSRRSRVGGRGTWFCPTCQPLEPASGGEELVEPAVAVEAPELGVAADRRRRRSGSAAPSSRPSDRAGAGGSAGSSSSEISS